MNLVGIGVAGAVAGVLATTVVFPLFVYALVLFEIVLRPWSVLRHLRRLRPSYALSLGIVFSFILVGGFGIMAWFDPPDETVAGPDTMSPAEFQAFWVGLLVGLIAVVMFRRWLSQRAASRPTAGPPVGPGVGQPAPFTRPLRFNPPPSWPPAPPGWTPPPGWVPPANFPPPAPGWRFWI